MNSVLLFLNAGHDNVSATLTWALWLLAHDPNLQAAIRNEWASGPVASGADLVEPAAYPIAGAIVSETLRLYPPVLHLTRESNVDLEIDGQRLPSGFTAILSLYAMHRNRQWWHEPDLFRPGRFMPGSKQANSQSLWLPFGIGPRGCIGASFARLELVVALGSILSQVELAPNPEQSLTCSADWVLRPEGRNVLLARALL